jgi:hypothetical protein
MAGILDRCQFNPTANGTADFVVSAALTGYQTPASAGAVNGKTYYYGAESLDKTQWELGLGTYSTGTTTLARTTILYSSSGGSKVNFTFVPNVFVTFLAENIANTSDIGLVKPDGTTISINGSGVISVNSAFDAGGANPTATAGPAAVNGSAATFMRSDGAPAVQLCTSGQKGIAQVDNTTIVASSGVISVAAAYQFPASVKTADVVGIIDGGGSAITGGKLIYVTVDFPCTINQVTLLADQSGSLTCNIWKCTYSQFDAGSTHPVTGDSITASDTPALSSATKYQDSTLTGWTTSITAGDILAFQIPSNATAVTRLTVTLKVTKT